MAGRTQAGGPGARVRGSATGLTGRPFGVARILKSGAPVHSAGPTARAMYQIHYAANMHVPYPYRLFGQARCLDFRMEPYGNGGYVVDPACRATAVAVEKSSIRLLVVANCPLEVGGV